MSIISFTRSIIPKALTGPISRNIWTKVTATGASIDECIESCQPTLESNPDICVALASKSFTAQDYQQLMSKLQSTLSPTVLMGGVVDRVSQVDHGISLLLGYNETIVPFTINDSENRQKVRTISVGRWGRVEETDRVKSQNEHVDKVGWDQFGSISTSIQTHQLPPGIQQKNETPSFIFSISDNEPDELLKSFDHHYPGIAKTGIIGSSTPFVTGQPYTLFHEHFMGSGIIGFAAYDQSHAPTLTVEHTALEPIGKPLKITRCRGNVILDLDEAGATGLLIHLIQNGQQISKDEEFYLGIYPLDDESSQHKLTVNRITSGDPRRGNMSVDTTMDFEVGQTVQVEHNNSISSKALSPDSSFFIF
ncbi:hypothetical protein BDB01DRAFT_169626 [Pilobolus umbonatus]|nr:hypothetical protein BDB01DRAFT_169626 [Pilobolus umbonatus]